MKKFTKIGVQVGLVLVLVLSLALGRVMPVAEASDGNQVHAGFETAYRYRTVGDFADNPTTNLPTHLSSWLHNAPDDTGDNVTSPTLEFSTTQTVTDVRQEYLVSTDPTYRWEFPDISENRTRSAWADIDQIVGLSTGLLVSRSANQTSFPPTGGTEELTLSVTPKEAMERLEIHGRTNVSGLDIATITSVTPEEGIHLHPDGRSFHVGIDGPTANVTYQWQITIDIGPLPTEFPPVELEYMPYIQVSNVDFIASGSSYGSGVSGNTTSLDGVTVLGTWTWQATGDYSWRWGEKVSRRVELDGYAELQYNRVGAGFETSYRYRTAGDSVDNPTTDQPTHLHSWLHNQVDDTGDNVTSPTLELSTTENVTWVRQEYLVSGPPPPYRWEFDDIVQDRSQSAWADIDQMVELSTSLSVSRSANQTSFPPTGGTMELTLSVTPKEAMDRLEINVWTEVDGLDIATIYSVSGSGIHLHPDGRGFHARIDGPTANITYPWQITINIGSLPPEFLALEYMPRIHVSNVDVIASNSFYGSSLSGESRSLIDQATVLGTWTWQATGDYWWSWEQKLSKRIELEGYAMRSYWDAPTPETINQAIDDGRAWLRTQQDLDPLSEGYGSWHWGRPARPNKTEIVDHPNVGMTALAVWSLLHHGVPETDPAVSAGINFILSKQLLLYPEKPHYGAITSLLPIEPPRLFQPTYETSLSILALIATGNPAYSDNITLAADYLARSQNDEGVYYRNLNQTGIDTEHWAYGGWGYRYGMESNQIWVGGVPQEVPWHVWSDLSNTQFAMIALRAAQDAGVVLSHDTWGNVWSKAIGFVSRCQTADGGFGYKPTWELETHGSYGAMTAAGVWNLRAAGVPITDTRVQAGLAWLDHYPFYDRNPWSNQYHYYYLWSAAKAFTYSDRPPVLVEDNWYYDFAGYLVAYQQDGTDPQFALGQWVNPVWPEGESHLNATLYALLVLERMVLPQPPCATITVQVDKHIVQTGTHPGSTKGSIEGLKVQVFDKAQILADGLSASWQNYETIWKGYLAVASGLTDANGSVTFALPAGDYIIVGQYTYTDETGETCTLYMGVSASDLTCGDDMKKYLQAIQTAAGKKLPAKYIIVPGSELMIIEPEYVEWTDTSELYPFVFESLGDWSVTVEVSPPEGFVSDYDSLSEEVNSELKAVQFTITDVGSKWTHTEVTYKIKHKGKSQIAKSRIHMFKGKGKAKGRLGSGS